MAARSARYPKNAELHFLSAGGSKSLKGRPSRRHATKLAGQLSKSTRRAVETTVQLNKIIHFTVYSDGLQVQKESGKDIYLLGEGDWQVAGACLDAAARQAR
jgi:hypothetical protein